MRDIVVFGAGQIAELADFYFTHDSDHRVVAFTVDGAYVKEDRFAGKPVVPFEDVTRHYAPDAVGFFVAVSYSKINRLRTAKVAEAKAAGYRLTHYLSSRATYFPGFEPQENCFILEDNTIQPFVKIGANVTLWSGNHIGHHSVIKDNCFIASQVVISGGVTIEQGCFIGVNATLRDHITIGAHSVIGAGALVLENAPDESVYPGKGTERAPIPSSKIRSI